MDYLVHPTSIVDEGASVGHGSKVWHWSHISGTATIGNNCSIGQNVYVGNNVTIGSNVKIQNNVSVYDEVVLEDYVFCGPSMVFTNVINPRSKYPRKTEYKSTIVKKGATLGANCTIVCGVTIGFGAFVAAGAVITKNVKPYALMVGVPARHVGWVSEYGNKIDLPLTGSGSWVCPDTSQTYQLNGDNLQLLY